MNKDYLILCRAVKYKHLGIANNYLRELFFTLKPKHMLWFMKFSKNNGVIWTNKKS
nr:MAG TPA: hypothetical protein [Caudoviricetes sp.]